MAVATRGLTRLYERVGDVGSGRVDRASGVIRGVRVIGSKSKNGRTYPDRLLRESVTLYEGKAVYWTHNQAKFGGSRERDPRDQVGWLRNVRFENGALFADLHVIKEARDAGLLFSLAEGHHTIGLSHDASGDVDPRGTVTRLESVNSVDIVSNAATNSNLFESASLREMEAAAIRDADSANDRYGSQNDHEITQAIQAVEQGIESFLKAYLAKPGVLAKQSGQRLDDVKEAGALLLRAMRSAAPDAVASVEKDKKAEAKRQASLNDPGPVRESWSHRRERSDAAFREAFPDGLSYRKAAKELRESRPSGAEPGYLKYAKK